MQHRDLLKQMVRAMLALPGRAGSADKGKKQIDALLKQMAPNLPLNEVDVVKDHVHTLLNKRMMARFRKGTGRKPKQRQKLVPNPPRRDHSPHWTDAVEYRRDEIHQDQA
jgi:hypothetical protein